MLLLISRRLPTSLRHTWHWRGFFWALYFLYKAAPNTKQWLEDELAFSWELDRASVGQMKQLITTKLQAAGMAVEKHIPLKHSSSWWFLSPHFTSFSVRSQILPRVQENVNFSIHFITWSPEESGVMICITIQYIAIPQRYIEVIFQQCIKIVFCWKTVSFDTELQNINTVSWN